MVVGVMGEALRRVCEMMELSCVGFLMDRVMKGLCLVLFTVMVLGAGQHRPASKGNSAFGEASESVYLGCLVFSCGSSGFTELERTYTFASRHHNV